MLDAATLLASLVGLWAGTELVIRAAVGIAGYLRLSELFIGVAVLSIGSDLPELAVAVEAGIRTHQGMDASGIVVGSSIGSAFGQIGLVMGISGLAGFMIIPRRYVYGHGAALLGSIVLLFICGWDGRVTKIEGVVLVAAFIVYLSISLYEERTQTHNPPRKAARISSSLVLLVAGMTLVIISSHATVQSATKLAEYWAVPQSLIAVVIIGVGTSLPELTISIGALLKKKSGMSVGNLIGSNILDVLVPIGIAAGIAPVSIELTTLWFDIPALFTLSTLVLLFFVLRHGLQKTEAVLVLMFYFGYVFIKLGSS